jgi:hypothetical protein
MDLDGGRHLPLSFCFVLAAKILIGLYRCQSPSNVNIQRSGWLGNSAHLWLYRRYNNNNAQK